VQHRKPLAIAALLFAAIAWGATFVVVKAAIAKIEPELFIFVRFLLGGLILLLFATRRHELNRHVLRDGAVLGLALGLGYWLQTRGLLTISPARSAFLTGLAVVLAPLADHLLFRKTISARTGAGVVLALAGTVVLTGGWRGEPALGDLLTLGCAAMFALHLVLTSRFAARRPAVGLAAVQVMMVAILAAPVAAGQPLAPLRDHSVIAAVLVTAILTTAVALLFMVWAQARLSATEAGIILSFEPVAAAITSIAAGGESLTMTLIAGGALVLVAMLLSQTGTLPADARYPNPGHQR
jgi:drug/metabolite transporter (DMT)-like permease